MHSSQINLKRIRTLGLVGLAVTITGASSPEGCESETDADGDGVTSSQGDCDDTNKNTYPGAPELCDQLDNDCDAQIDEGLTGYYPDADGDGYGDKSATGSCLSQTGYVANGSDCDDANPRVNPAAAEGCNGIDDNCDGSIDEVHTGEIEPNDGLTSAQDKGNLNGDTQAITYTWQGTIATSSDTSDFFRFYLLDDFTIGADGFFINAVLTGIASGADYDLYLWWDDPTDAYFPGTQIVESSNNTGNADEALRHTGDSGPENGGYYWLEVRRVSGSDCARPYTLSMENMG